MMVKQGKVRCNAKSLICFWLSCGVFLLSAWKNVGMNRTKMLSFGIGIHEELEGGKTTNKEKNVGMT